MNSLPCSLRDEWPFCVGHKTVARPPVPYHLYSKADRPTLDPVIFILSQSTTGRQVLNSVYEAGYSIERVDQPIDTREAFVGFCDHRRKRILLSASLTPVESAILLGHEARHVEQSFKFGITSDWTDTLKTTLRWSRVIEADAFAHDALMAAELLLGDPRGPEHQLVFPESFEFIKHRLRRIQTLEAIAYDEKAMIDGKALAAGFEAFFDLPVSRRSYEAFFLDGAHRLDFKFIRNPGMLIHDRSADHFIDMLSRDGKPSYVRQHLPDLDMKDARHAGLYPDMAKEYDDFERKVCAVKGLPYHQADSLVYAPPPITSQQQREILEPRALTAIQSLRKNKKFEGALRPLDPPILVSPSGVSPAKTRTCSAPSSPR